jgi:hypothetical protein
MPDSAQVKATGSSMKIRARESYYFLNLQSPGRSL